MKEMEEQNRDTTTVHFYHKKEAKWIILADTKDRTGLLKTLDTYFHASEPPGENIVNILSGKTDPAVAIVDRAVNSEDTMLQLLKRPGQRDFTSPSHEDAGNTSWDLDPKWPKYCVFKGHFTAV